MGSQTFDILRQGFWASLSGGWFYDPHQSVFANTFHLYAWLFLLGLPFSVYLYFPHPNLYVKLGYSLVVLAFFAFLKFINMKLHEVFDTTECIEETIQELDPASPDERRPGMVGKIGVGKKADNEVGIEMQDLGPKLSPSSAHTPPVECSSRASLSDVGASASHPKMPTTDQVIQAGAIRDSVAAAAANSNHDSKLNCSTFDLKVDVHCKPVSGNSSQDEKDEAKKEDASTEDVVIVVDESPNPKSEKSMESMASNFTAPNSDSRGRRYSNLSNLARSLPPSSSTSSHTAFPVVAGSLDLAAIMDHPKRGRHVRRTRSALETSTNPPPSHPVSLEAGMNGSRSDRVPDQTISEIAEVSDEIGAAAKEEASCDSELDDEAESPLLLRHQSLDPTTVRFHSSSSRSLDDEAFEETASRRHSDTKATRSQSRKDTKRKKRKKPKTSQRNHSFSAGDGVHEATNEYLISQRAQDAPDRHRRNSGPFVSMGGGLPRAPTDSETPSLLSAIGPLDWLFTDSEPDPPPSSPKSVNVTTTTTTRPRTSSSSQGSSGTDNETRTLLARSDQSQGAIPKKRLSLDVSADADETWKRRAAIRRRPTLDESSPESSDPMSGSPGEDTDNGTAELRRRILHILSAPNEDCERELSKLRKELDQRRRLAGGGAAESSSSSQRRRKRRKHGSLDQQPDLDTTVATSRRSSSTAPPATSTALASILGGPGTHLAASREDTSDGAVHCFQDEHGNWHSYTFATSSGSSVPVPSTNTRVLANILNRQEQGAWAGSGVSGPADRSRSNSNVSVSSGLTVILDSPAMVFQPKRSEDDAARQAEMAAAAARFDTTPVTMPSSSFRPRYRTPLGMVESIYEQVTARGGGTTGHRGSGSAYVTTAISFSAGETAAAPVRTQSGGDRPGTPVPSSTMVPARIFLAEQPPIVKRYYRLKISPWTYLRVGFDRLALLAVLDRNLSAAENLLSVLLAVMVAVCSSFVLERGHYHDLWIFLFCAVTAGCQYTLIKSVQPDSASPTHGFNRITVFNRPVYFVLSCALVICLDEAISCDYCENTFNLYGYAFPSHEQLTFTRDLVLVFILAFPLIFLLGLLPQINTFIMYLFEQIDIHIFGGNATSSLLSSIYCVFRSLLAVCFLIGFAYGGITDKAHSEQAQEILFSIFCALAVTISYHLSRSSSDPTVVLHLMKRYLIAENPSEAVPTSSDIDAESTQQPPEEAIEDPLPKKLMDTVYSRLRSDAILCLLIAVVSFFLHWSGLFIKLQPDLSYVLWIVAGVVGLLVNYILPQLRKQLPWLCFAHPALKSYEYDQFEVGDAARVMWFEKLFIWIKLLEKTVVYPMIFLSALTVDIEIFKAMPHWSGSIILVVTTLKCMRASFSDCSKQYLILAMTILFFQYNPETGGFDGRFAPEHQAPFIVSYFITSIVFHKLHEFYLKVQFVITYIAPWQITWGSAFHAFAQPFSVPHSAMLFMQAAISSVLSTPLNPILGSAIFITSYVRPIKFWERDYNTKRVDHSNTRLSSHLERNPGADDNNLNSIFYEHLTRSLQNSLCGDIMLGRWGVVAQGDCFVLASDYLNCLVHIIELANGLVTFQVRGLEFRGTYCQQREVEAISEGVDEDMGCCCCEPGHLPHMLSVNASFAQRWLAWEVSATKYVLEGYSISDNSAQSILQVFDLRKVLINYYVKSIIYYTIRSPKLEEWLNNTAIQDALKPTLDKNFVDLDPLFNMNIDEDFDFRSSGITRASFCNVYHDWITFCAQRRGDPPDHSKDSPLMSLCFALSLLGRRALGAASHNFLTSVDFFLIGLHALFKGDFRITSVRDEWVFCDMELLRKVVAPGVRMSVKLHQDHFMSPDEYDDCSVLYDAISGHEQNLVISHEGDPAWRTAVLSGAPSLLALRHVVDDGADEYKIIMLNKRHISFRVIKLNQECVRGLWAGQQQELIFLRNRNPERGSIQNAKQALRNIINSSCDQPIGYPIYVSPLTTSFYDTNKQVTKIIGGPISLAVIKSTLLKCWHRVWHRCGEGCSSGSSLPVECDAAFVPQTSSTPMPPPLPPMPPLGGAEADPPNRASLASNASKPSSGTLVSLAGLLGSGGGHQSVSSLDQTTPNLSLKSGTSITGSRKTLAGDVKVRIVDPMQVYDNINLGRRIDPLWPDEAWRAAGGRISWKDWLPDEGMEGTVVHRWVPCHRELMKRSHVDKTILLLKIEDKYVPIVETAVKYLDNVEKRPPPSEEDKDNMAVTFNSESGAVVLPTDNKLNE